MLSQWLDYHGASLPPVHILERLRDKKDAGFPLYAAMAARELSLCLHAAENQDEWAGERGAAVVASLPDTLSGLWMGNSGVGKKGKKGGGKKGAKKGKVKEEVERRDCTGRERLERDQGVGVVRGVIAELLSFPEGLYLSELTDRVLHEANAVREMPIKVWPAEILSRAFPYLLLHMSRRASIML